MQSTAGQLTKETMNYHGACLLKVLFRFKDPKILVKSLLSLKDELLFLMRHEYGSFVIEEFLVSNNVAKVHKTNLLLRIKVLDLLSYIIIHYHTLSYIVVYYHSLSVIIVSTMHFHLNLFHLYLSIIIHYYKLSYIFTYYHLSLSSIVNIIFTFFFIHCHFVHLIIIYYHMLLLSV